MWKECSRKCLKFTNNVLQPCTVSVMFAVFSGSASFLQVPPSPSGLLSGNRHVHTVSGYGLSSRVCRQRKNPPSVSAAQCSLMWNLLGRSMEGLSSNGLQLYQLLLKTSSSLAHVCEQNKTLRGVQRSLQRNPHPPVPAEKSDLMSLITRFHAAIKDAGTRDGHLTQRQPILKLAYSLGSIPLCHHSTTQILFLSVRHRKNC